MTSATVHVPTASASKYLKQLCKHWSHKLDVELGDDEGTVRFPEAVATMSATTAELVVTVAADSAETLERMKGVVANHLDRFAFREAPLPFNWS
ncbi:MAG: DUF2218 domain-containing protein [Rhizobiaceae bacterium]|nr:DUF2218 domain-containing protein [Rhizobiaceae bacterium]